MPTIIERAADLSAALMAEDDAFAQHDSAGFVNAATKADVARFALAAMPGPTLAEITAKSQALGPVPAAGLASARKAKRL
jgi:hypothetical protein